MKANFCTMPGHVPEEAINLPPEEEDDILPSLFSSKGRPGYSGVSGVIIPHIQPPPDDDDTPDQAA